MCCNIRKAVNLRIDCFFLLEDYIIEHEKEIMQKNAFRKIWTLLSHRVLRGIRAYDYNRVPKAPFVFAIRTL